MTNNKGVSIAITLNYCTQFTVGFIAKPLFEHKTLGDYSFIFFGLINTVVTLIAFACMKETKGLSEQQLTGLYTKVGKVMDITETEMGFKEFDKEEEGK